ncbi:LacI family DNA-binding transcriptional regulator [Deinococcus planocerae]|uniref:LacI family DNA-binding transcriptional regulator n=1 Tax=Deinococcus planocerae TaxID=1737569 RepID=UPI000C7F2241|nr:LacI family DNA-binding transcriptional regulator [Deinococcus planocerae]
MTRATLRDVAAHAGVSHQTVSNVLNDHPSIRPATRERVLDAIRALDYHPNAAAKALRESRVTTLCCAFYGHAADEINDPYRNLVQSAFIAEANARGYSITTAMLQGGQPEGLRALRTAFLGRSFGGVVVVSTTLPPEWMRALEGWEIPAVLFDRSDPAGGLPSVTADYAGGVAGLVAYHVARGRRDLALVGPGDDFGTSAVLRREGFLAAARAHGVRARIEEGAWTAEAGGGAFRRLWGGGERPGAVLCGNDRMGAGALFAARTLGVRVPGEVAVSGFDDFEFARYTAPSLTTAHVPHGEMARLAVRRLLGRLEGHAPAHESAEIRLPVTLVPRESA